MKVQYSTGALPAWHVPTLYLPLNLKLQVPLILPSQQFIANVIMWLNFFHIMQGDEWCTNVNFY